MKIDVKSISTITLEKDEVLVVQLPEDCTSGDCYAVKKQFNTLFPGGKVLVFCRDVKMSKIKKEDISA